MPPPSSLSCLVLVSHQCSHLSPDLDLRRILDPVFFRAHRHMTGDPMLLMLGDHIYRSTHEQGTSCVRQQCMACQSQHCGQWPFASCGHVGFPSPLVLQRGQPLVYELPVSSTQVQQLLSSYDGGSIMARTHVHTVKKRVGCRGAAAQAIWLTSTHNLCPMTILTWTSRHCGAACMCKRSCARILGHAARPSRHIA